MPCGVAWDHSTWDYDSNKLGSIYVIFKKDNKIVVSFGTDRIAKESTNDEIITSIRDKASAMGILSKESAIYETRKRIDDNKTVEKKNDVKPQRNEKIVDDKAANDGGQIIEKTDEKTVYKRICYLCNGKGKFQAEKTKTSFAKDDIKNDKIDQTCSVCKGKGYLIFVDLVGKYRNEKSVSPEELDDYLKEECQIKNKIFNVIENIKQQYSNVINKDSFWYCVKKHTTLITTKQVKT